VVAGLLPPPCFLDEAVAARLAGQLRAGPDVIKPAALILLAPEAAVRPPRIVAIGRGNELAAEIFPTVRVAKLAERFDFDRRVTDDLEQGLVIVDVAVQRGDVEIADDQRRTVERIGPAG